MPDGTPASPTAKPPVAAPGGEEELAARLRLAVMRLARRLRQQTVGDLSPTLISALATVERHGPLTLGRLAELEGVKRPSVTRIVAGLEEGGLVRSEVGADDRRVRRVSVTPAGRRLLQRSRTRKTAYLARHLRELSREEAAALAAAADALERLLEGDT
jgi:DNA-binding MarR family transcriptional regulator